MTCVLPSKWKSLDPNNARSGGNYTLLVTSKGEKKYLKKSGSKNNMLDAKDSYIKRNWTMRHAISRILPSKKNPFHFFVCPKPISDRKFHFFFLAKTSLTPFVINQSKSEKMLSLLPLTSCPLWGFRMLQSTLGVKL